MNKVLKIVSTILIVIGLGYVFLYITSVNSSGVEILENPSYFTRQNFWYVFLAGAAVLCFSILTSFFAWHKDAWTKDEILLNAGFADKEKIAEWVSGSTLDVENTNVISDKEPNETEILSGSDMGETEILSDCEPDETEILSDGDMGKTEILVDENTDETEILIEEELT